MSSRSTLIDGTDGNDELGSVGIGPAHVHRLGLDAPDSIPNPESESEERVRFVRRQASDSGPKSADASTSARSRARSSAS